MVQPHSQQIMVQIRWFRNRKLHCIKGLSIASTWRRMCEDLWAQKNPPIRFPSSMASGIVPHCCCPRYNILLIKKFLFKTSTTTIFLFLFISMIPDRLYASGYSASICTGFSISPSAILQHSLPLGNVPISCSSPMLPFSWMFSSPSGKGLNCTVQQKINKHSQWSNLNKSHLCLHWNAPVDFFIPTTFCEIE